MDALDFISEQSIFAIDLSMIREYYLKNTGDIVVIIKNR
jgi:hypothetical protein